MNAFKLTQLWILLLFIGLAVVSCKEDDMDGLEETNEETPTAPSPEVGPGDGAFWGISTVTTTTQPVIGELDTELGTAVAVFTNDNFTSYIDAGAVSVMGNNLNQNDNNSYTYIPGLTQAFGLEYTDSYEWSVAGSTGVPGFSHTVNFPFPALGKITSAETVSKSEGYTLSCASVSQADSIIYMVGGFLKVVAGNVTSVEFTADDLKDVATGPSFIQVAAYTYKPENIGGKTYYFGNETVRSLAVEIE